MKHLIYFLTISLFIASCGGSESKEVEANSANNESDQTSQEAKDPAMETESYTTLQELDDQLVKNDLTIDINVAKELYTRSIEFSKTYPESENLEIVLSYAAKGAEGIENYKEAVEILHKLAYDIPESNKTVIYMYNKGKILEEKLKDKDAAKAAYKELIKRFPRNPISKNMKSYLSNGLIDMTKEEKIKYLQEQNQ